MADVSESLRDGSRSKPKRHLATKGTSETSAGHVLDGDDDNQLHVDDNYNDDDDDDHDDDDDNKNYNDDDDDYHDDDDDDYDNDDDDEDDHPNDLDDDDNDDQHHHDDDNDDDEDNDHHHDDDDFEDNDDDDDDEDDDDNDDINDDVKNYHNNEEEDILDAQVDAEEEDTNAHHHQDQDKAKFNDSRDKRIASLKKALPRQSPPSKSPTVSGSVDFFFSTWDKRGQGEIWKRTRIMNRRVSPSDGAFSGNLGVICLSCPNYSRANNGGRGHTALVYNKGRWTLFLVWKLTPTSLHGYMVNRKSIEAMEEDNQYLVESKLDLTGSSDTLFTFVSVYGWGGQLRDPAFLNPIDGMLNVGERPSSMWLPYPTIYGGREPSVPMLASGEGGKKRRRGTRGGDRGKKAKRGTAPSWLRRDDHAQPFLVIYLTREAMEKSPLHSLSLQDFTDTADCPLFLLPDPYWRKPKTNAFFVPIKHYLLSKSQVASMNQGSNSKFRKLSLKFPSVELLRVISTLPLRFMLLESYEDLVERPTSVYHSKVLFHFEVSNLHPNGLPGVPISTWVGGSEKTSNRFDVSDAHMMQDRFGTFFGSRKTVPSCGMNGYLGPRLSGQPSPTPALGPGTLFQADYFRQHFAEEHLHPYLRSKMLRAAYEVRAVAKAVSPTMLQFVGLDTCTRIIWTQGTLERQVNEFTKGGGVVQKTKKLDGFVGFFNKAHYDPMDKLDKKHYSPWFEDISKYRATDGYKKLEDYERGCGIGLPTTCGYNIITPVDTELKASFLQTFFSIEIMEGTVHHFCGWAFPHCTAVPFLRVGDRVITQNSKESEAYVMAWGSSGGRAHAVVKNLRRSERLANKTQGTANQGQGGGAARKSAGGRAVTGRKRRKKRKKLTNVN